MTIFENVKASVAPKDAAERYGIKKFHNNMICCPFHIDKHLILRQGCLRFH